MATAHPNLSLGIGHSAYVVTSPAAAAACSGVIAIRTCAAAIPAAATTAAAAWSRTATKLCTSISTQSKTSWISMHHGAARTTACRIERTACTTCALCSRLSTIATTIGTIAC